MSGLDPDVAAWLAKAEHDALNIRNNLSAPEIPWDTVCFHAQQAAEKLLKALLLSQGKSIGRTHDLVALLADAAATDPSLSALESDCRNLTHFAVSSRYPDDLYDPNEQDGRAMVQAMQRVRSAVLTRLNKSE